MKLSIRPIIIIIAMSATLLSCAKQVTEDDDTIEQRALDAWIAKYVPHAQKLGDYGIYYEVITPAEPTAKKLDLTNWIFTDYTIKDLDGNIIYNRNEEVARQQGQYTKYTRYVPDYIGIPDDITRMSAMQGMYYGYIDMKEGEVRRLYIPSKYAYGSGSLQNSYGYGGQYSLGSYSPIILDELVATEVVSDPKERQKDIVDKVAAAWKTENPAEIVTIEDYFYMQILKRESSDTIPVGKNVKFHFVGRYIDDGAVFDTNIDTVWSNSFGEVRKYDSVKANSITREKVMSPESMPELTFSYLIPKLHYGDSVRVVTISDYAYQDMGKPGYRQTKLSTDGDDFATLLLLSYMGGNQESAYYTSEDYWSMMYFMSATAQNETVTEPVPEVKLYTPVIFTFVVMGNPDVETEE